VPADRALERGLAAAMSYGLASELVDLGMGKKPARKSQLGAVCYSCIAALGDVPAFGACSADQQYIWAKAADGTGYWRRRRSGEACGVVTTVTGEVRTGGGAPKVESTYDVAMREGKMLQLGPFLIPLATATMTLESVRWKTASLTSEQQAFIADNVKKAANIIGNAANVTNGSYPFIKFDRDDIPGKKFGLYFRETSDGGFTLTSKEYVPGDSIFTKIWNGIKAVAAKVVNFVKDAANWVKDKACDLMTSSVGQVAGAAAGAAVGGAAGAQAGAMGAQIAGQACTAPSTGAPPMMPPEESNITPLLLIGGAGLAAVLLLGRKKT
jgi:hypothetical protein